MKILVLNAGSSSLKYRLFRRSDWQTLASGTLSRIGEPQGELRGHWIDEQGRAQDCQDTLPMPDHSAALQRMAHRLRKSGVLSRMEELAVIGHRVVHGGEAFQAPKRIDEQVLATIQRMSALAPLHNPANLAGIRVAQKLFPQIPQVAVFDTAFHQSMPPAAYRYALPAFLYEKHGVRRYGFHGTSHAYVCRRGAALLQRPLERCNLISFHLGNGASVAAVRGGKCLDTSMGFTPLEGLVMGTRCGDLDPALPLYLMEQLGWDRARIDQLLNRESGLRGLCGRNDMRAIHRQAEQGDPQALLAIQVFCHRLKKYLGAYYALLGEVHGLIFTGGIGENDPKVRACACEGLQNLGIQLDPAANAASASEARRISTPESPVPILVIPTNEELEIARQALAALDG